MHQDVVNAAVKLNIVCEQVHHLLRLFQIASSSRTMANLSHIFSRWFLEHGDDFMLPRCNTSPSGEDDCVHNVIDMAEIYTEPPPHL